MITQTNVPNTAANWWPLVHNMLVKVLPLHRPLFFFFVSLSDIQPAGPNNSHQVVDEHTRLLCTTQFIITTWPYNTPQIYFSFQCISVSPVLIFLTHTHKITPRICLHKCHDKFHQSHQTADTYHSHTGSAAAQGTGWTSSCGCHWDGWTRATALGAGAVPATFAGRQGRGQGVQSEAGHPVISQTEWRRQTCNRHN